MIGMMADPPTTEELVEQLKIMIDYLAHLSLTLDTAARIIEQNKQAIRSVTNWAYDASDRIMTNEECVKGLIKRYYEDGHPHTDKKSNVKSKGIVEL